MRGEATEKVPGGKLVRISVEHDRAIRSVTITGDFFLHPEDGLERVEECLAGLPLDVQEEDLRRRVEAVVAEEGIEMVGISPEAIARLVKRAVPG